MFLEKNKETIQMCLSAITQEAIAEIAGVTKQTVSNSFTDASIIAVSESTKEKITESALSLISERVEKGKALLNLYQTYKSTSEAH